MTSDNEAYFASVNKSAVGSCNDARAFNEKEYNYWLSKFKGAHDDSQTAES